MNGTRTVAGLALVAIASGVVAPLAMAHGDVQPQAVNTEGLKPLGDKMLEENPYRGDPKAIAVGFSAFTQNCARCHGLEAISGGLAPDLRYLELGKEGDTWFMERIQNGAMVNGVYKMPPFKTVFNQEAMWAIRSYLESRHED
ncbi:cytochrome c-550 PedF [Methylorubrum extorquens]|jgi:cytochrome c-550 PedF|uniref:Cytochrome c-550 PedF n=1 Tax=Methylorubrum extorquens TaxID=408 RepID=A0AAX3WN21_METEX|nr:cytochrome c-550 PedF [Methylorubrum extorquens]WHQ72913.1 cytochrome c-550 PedF [Methylorubrum extorquens]